MGEVVAATVELSQMRRDTMRQKALALFVAVSLGCCAGGVQADTITVCLDGSCDFDTIQAAVNSSSPGDVIEIGPGVYREEVNAGGVTLIGTSAKEATIIDGEQKRRGLVSATTVVNLTIRNCVGDPKYGDGSALSASDSFVSVTNCVFENNAAEDGGACYHYKGGAYYEGCRFVGNTASDKGGALYMNELDLTSSINNCVFEGNVATADRGGDGLGGALYAINFFDGSLVVSSCVFSGNSSAFAGGALITGDADLEVVDTTFQGNSSLNGGAVAVTDKAGTFAPSFERCFFTESEATFGGHVYTQLAVAFSDCVFGRSVAGLGGCIYLEGALACGSSACCLQGCVFIPDLPVTTTLIEGDSVGFYKICNSIACTATSDQVIGVGATDGGGNEFANNCPDCDNDGLPNAAAIRLGFSEDLNGDGIPDECGACPDEDKDGVCDDDDQCPGEVDQDSDGDGVVDCLDGCPEDNQKTDPQRCGCGLVDTTVAGDFDCDGDFDIDDYEAMQEALGICIGDLNGDGEVSGADLTIVLGFWGICP